VLYVVTPDVRLDYEMYRALTHLSKVRVLHNENVLCTLIPDKHQRHLLLPGFTLLLLLPPPLLLQNLTQIIVTHVRVKWLRKATFMLDVVFTNISTLSVF